jgi:heme exporter protein C
MSLLNQICDTQSLTQGSWYKYTAALFVIFSLIAGLLISVPAMPILHESIRNLFYHVPMWFAMLWILLLSFIYSVRYLLSFDKQYDMAAAATAQVGIWFGLLGLVTGMIWAKYTWGEYWSNDPKQTASAIGMLIYFAYFILRGAMDDADKRAKVSAVYNIFAYCILIPLLFIIPRITDSLHPGNGGNPGFSPYDLDNTMRLVFYPSIIGWICLGVWLSALLFRIEKLRDKKWSN